VRRRRPELMEMEASTAAGVQAKQIATGRHRRAVAAVSLACTPASQLYTSTAAVIPAAAAANPLCRTKAPLWPLLLLAGLAQQSAADSALLRNFHLGPPATVTHHGTAGIHVLHCNVAAQVLPTLPRLLS
jgi:fatty acid desaturase